MKKRLLGILLVLCMVLAIMPMAVGAADDPEAVWGADADSCNNSGTLTAALTAANATEGTYIKLEKDVQLSSLLVSSGTNTTLDLAGYTITAADGEGVLYISNNTSLVLTDSSAADTGKLTGGTGSNGWAGGVAVMSGATFTMEGGTITGNTSAYSVAGVSLGSNSKFVMTGGTITGNTTTYSSGLGIGGVYASTGSVEVSGAASIYGNTGYDGGTMDIDLWLNTLASKYLAIGDTGLDASARIGVFINSSPSVSKEFTTAYDSGKASADNFFSNRSKHHVEEVDAENGQKQLVMVLQNAAAPVASVEPGAYHTAQTVELSTTSLPSYSKIYYTLDGSDPKTSETATLYTGALTISETTTVKAYTQGLSGDTQDSTVAEFTYTIDPYYAVTVNKAENGSVTADLDSATEGTEITLTVIPDADYELDSLTVVDAEGESVALTSSGDGTYTFDMPGSAVTVSAAFKALTPEPVEPDEPCDGGENCPSKPYFDVDQEAWYHEHVDFVIKNGYMIGTSSDPLTFSTGESITRAQVVQTLYQMEGEPEYTKTATYPDLNTEAWYMDAISWATENGIVEGRDTGVFDPDVEITREELVTVIYRYVKEFKGLSVDTADGIPSAYTDSAKVGSFAEAPFAWAIDREIINGITATTLEPQTDARRCEMAKIISMLCKAYPEIP